MITDDEPGGRHNVVVRPATQCIKLFKMEDTPYAKNMKEIRLLAEQILKRKGEVTDGINDQAPDDAPEIITVQNDEETDSEKTKVLREVKEYFKEERTKLKRRRKSEVEKLKIDNKEFQDVLGKRKSPL